MNVKKKVAVYGASGYTGGLVAKELISRGFAPVLAGRSRDALVRVAKSLGGASSIAVAELDNPVQIYNMLDGVDVLINCAGPLSDTALTLATAAIDVGSHYLDTNAVEQLAAKRLFDELSEAARRAQVTIIPGMATFGSISDLLASRAARGLHGVTDVTVGYLVEGWIPTRGSLATAARAQDSPKLTFDTGRFSVATESPRLGSFDFGDPFGLLDVVENYPGIEVATIPRHLTTKRVAVNMALSTLQKFQNLGLDGVARVEADAREETEFVIVVELHHDKGVERAAARGRDIYGFTAPILATAVERLAKDFGRSGVLAPGEAFDPVDFLGALSMRGLIVKDASH